MAKYTRVIPRDLFNEASLLKCLGKLALAAESEPRLTVYHDGDAFIVLQNPDSGGLHCANLLFCWEGEPMYLERPLNSRDPWPLYWERGSNSVEVFNQDGDVILGGLISL